MYRTYVSLLYKTVQRHPQLNIIPEQNISVKLQEVQLYEILYKEPENETKLQMLRPDL